MPTSTYRVEDDQDHGHVYLDDDKWMEKLFDHEAYVDCYQHTTEQM